MEAYRQGVPLSAIARQVGLARNTVRRYVRSDGFPEHAARRQRWRQMALFEAYLRERWNAGEQNAAALFREIQALGDRGSASTLREHLSRWRSEPRTPGRRAVALTGQVAPPPARTFSARQTRWLLVGVVNAPDALATASTEALLERSPPIRRAQMLVTEFIRLVRERDAASLSEWLSRAQQSEIAELISFADGVRRDYAAVEASLRLEWSQGQTEGQVHRLKLVKRQMYGRANLDLLRQRLLLAPTS
jgi:transposase